MNDERTALDNDDAFPDALRWQLRALRHEQPPSADLWGAIEDRIAPRAARSRPSPRFALAASVLLAVAAGGWLIGTRTAPGSDDTARREARSMSREYERALQAMPQAGTTPELAPAFAELDRTAHEIRRALQRDPDSRLLLEQLRRTYSLRVALSQRALVG